MARSSKRRRKRSRTEHLIDADWRVSAAFALVIWVGIHYLLPIVAGKSPLLTAVATAAQRMAWIPVSVLSLFACLSFLRTARRGLSTRSLPDLQAARMESDPQVPVEVSGVSVDQPALGDGRVRNLEIRDLAAVEHVIPPVRVEWSLDLIREIEWKRFEDVCQRYYELKGVRSSTTSLGADGGIDIRLFQDGDSERVTTVIQCKAWGERLVGVKPVRELLGVKVHEKADKAFFMTSGGYTGEARAFASANGITLMDGDMLLMMFRRLPPEMSAGLLAFATAGDYRTPTCPSCGVKMSARKGKGDGRPFWGCVRYPRCRQTLPMRAG